MKNEKNIAIILAAGQGKRMNSSVPKQYLMLGNKPILFYAIQAFEYAACIDEIILVVGHDQINYCTQEIVNKYNFQKVKKIISGGKERYDSVYCGIKEAVDADNIFIHDGARPFVSEKNIEDALKCVRKYDACVLGVPVKDTIKIVDKDNTIHQTPDRAYVWAIQTPQVFKKDIILEAYDKLSTSKVSNITDDAMVVEQMLGLKVKVVEGSYENIKITTPDDLKVGECYLK